MIIYVTKNLINGKKYIGKDSNNNPNYLGSGTLLKKAIKEYGRENFKKEILEECKNQQDLIKQEEYWLKYYDAANNENFYNLTNKPFGNSGLSNTTKEKISKAKKGTKLSKEIKQKMSNSRKGHKMYTNEWKEKISEAKKGIKLTEEHKKKISNKLKKIKKTDIWILAIKNNRKNCILAKSKPIIQLDKNNNQIKIYNSITEARNLTGIKGIKDALVGSIKTSGGYIWKYL